MIYMPALFRLALTTVAVKSLSPNFPYSPPGLQVPDGVRCWYVVYTNNFERFRNENPLPTPYNSCYLTFLRWL